MTQQKDDTYEYIINYIKNNKSKLPKNELKFLLSYASSLKKVTAEPSSKTIVEDLKELYKYLKTGPLTSIAVERLKKVMWLFEAILQNENLDEISYELDKLYIECGLSVRQNSALVKKIYSSPLNRMPK